MHVWALGLSCETPAAPPDRAAGARTRQPENSKRAHFRAPALQTPPKFHERPKREKEERKLWRGGGKKSANDDCEVLQLFLSAAEDLARGSAPPEETHFFMMAMTALSTTDAAVLSSRNCGRGMKFKQRGAPAHRSEVQENHLVSP